jgi:hypothetical protein
MLDHDEGKVPVRLFEWRRRFSMLFMFDHDSGSVPDMSVP